MEGDRGPGVDLLLEEVHGDLMLLTGLHLVSVGIPESHVLTIYKDYQLQTRGDFVVYPGKGDFLIARDFGSYASALRYKVYLVN